MYGCVKIIILVKGMCRKMKGMCNGLEGDVSFLKAKTPKHTITRVTQTPPL